MLDFKKQVFLKLLLKEPQTNYYNNQYCKTWCHYIKAGSEVDKLKEELKKINLQRSSINIFEIKRPELDAKLVADSIARQIEARRFLEELSKCQLHQL